MYEDSPLSKSTKTLRTPTKKVNESTSKYAILTRTQSQLQKEINRQEPSTSRANNTSEDTNHNTTIIVHAENNLFTAEERDNLNSPPTTPGDTSEEETIEDIHEIETQLTNIMDSSMLHIQKFISTTIPEFSGQNSSNRHNELVKFLASADRIYESLKKNADIEAFNALIPLRLTGEAFNRITYRNIDNYPELKQTLNDMYGQTVTLEELENKLHNTRQEYGETIRNYGYRLEDALDKYKSGYETKYDNCSINSTHNKHLQLTTIKIFKRGLNNTILKDKILTSSATTIKDVVDETELIEKLLSDTTTPTQTKHENLHTTPFQNNVANRETSTVTCNYCQKPYHTYDICRTRMAHEKMRNNNHRQSNFQSLNNTQRYNQHRQPQQINRASKFCTHCKIQGHTYDECITKLRQPRMNYQQYHSQPRNNYQQLRNNATDQRYSQGPVINRTPNYSPNYSPQHQYNGPHNYSNNNNQGQNQNHPPNMEQQKPNNHTPTKDLNDMFKKMMINMIEEHIKPKERQNSENYQGSSQE